jgi:glucose 1-dehydrogenase
MRLENKAAIVTGGARGIGAAIVRQFAQEGASVTIVDCSAPPNLDALMQNCAESGRPPLWIESDIASPEVHEPIVRRTIERFGKLDILVNNAGIQIRESFLEARPETWDRIFGVNLKGSYFLAQRAALAMPHGGKIINIASVHDETPHRNNSIYCLTKAAMKMLTKSLALELSERRIHVNSISPGVIATDINRDVLADEEFRRRLAAQVPLRRIGVPEDIAGAAVYLASAESDYVTGSTLYVDGGLLLQ